MIVETIKALKDTNLKIWNFNNIYCIYRYTSIHLHQQNNTIYKMVGRKAFRGPFPVNV
jgi:hypothetical protein